MPAPRPLRARRALARLAATVAAVLTLVVPATAPAATAAPVPAPPATAAPPATQVPQSYLAFDADTGAIVAAANEHAPHLTASTIKVLTALVTLERLPMTAKLRVTALAASQPAMKISMTEGSEWPMDQALVSLLMISANDAAYAMAENVGGSLDGFARIANTEARRLGMRDTTFKDPAGLDGTQGFGGGSTSSAYDLAIVTRDALAVPAITDDAAKVTYQFTDPNGVGRRLTNHNRGFLTGYPGAIGLKTGYTKAASRTLLAAARRGGHTCGVALMGTWDDTGWAGYLLDQCFAGVRVAGAPALPENRVRLAAATAPSATALDRAAATATTAPPPTTVAAKTPVHRPARRAAPVAGKAAPARTTEVTAAASGDSGSGVPWRTLLEAVGIVLVVLAASLVVLRRRALRRRRARRERQRALAEARRRGMIDVVDPDTTDSDLRVMPERTSHHVSASRRHQSDRRVVRPARPRGHAPTTDRR